MELHLVSLIGICTLIIIEGAPVSRFLTATELETSEDDDLHVAENRHHEVKGLSMFNKRNHQGISKAMKDQQTSEKISNNNIQIRNVQFPVPKAGSTKDSKDPQTGVNPGNAELTISIPRLDTDIMGNWVYNPWGVTFGDLFRDTRYNFGTQYTVPRMVLDSEPRMDYYPLNKERSTVCMGRTSPYNEPPVMAWLGIHMYKHLPTMRIDKELRKTLFKEGHPDECHTSKYLTFLDYMNCAVLRNQRMESKIPEYPKHQLIPDYDD